MTTHIFANNFADLPLAIFGMNYFYLMCNVL